MNAHTSDWFWAASRLNYIYIDDDDDDFDGRVWWMGPKIHFTICQSVSIKFDWLLEGGSDGGDEDSN